MSSYLLDTSCMAAAVCGWHEHHEPTRAALEERRRRSEKLVLAAPCLIESYAVLTRLPSPYRLAMADALALLEANWSRAAVVTLSAAEHWHVLRDCRLSGVSGGQAYDALIAACARKAKVDTLLTWNLAHFARFQGPLRVAAPSVA